MTSLNGNANTLEGSVGMFGGGGTAGTGASCGGFESVQPDQFQFAYTATSATPAVFTAASAVTNEGAFVNTSSTNLQIGDVVTLGYTAGPFPYTATSASPAVFTATVADLDGLHLTDLVANGMGVVLLGTSPAGFTSTVLAWSSGNPYNALTATTTQYYMVSISGATFQLSATQGGASINSTSAIAAPMSDMSMFMIYGGVPTGFSPFVPYYVVSQSNNTFQLAATRGGSSIASTSIGGGVFQLQRQMQTAPQIQYAAASGVNSTQMYKQGGWRTGLQPTTTASSLSLDENPQLAWQNVVGATCQTSYATGVGGASAGAGGVQVTGAVYNGWGAKGGTSVASGGAGQQVYELHINETNGKSETTLERKARLSAELDGLKAKASPTQKEKDRKAVVEKALNELK